MKRIISTVSLIIALTGGSAFAAMGGHGGMGHGGSGIDHHESMDQYGNGHYREMEQGSHFSGDHMDYGTHSNMQTMTDRMRGMIDQMSVTVKSGRLGSADMQVMENMMDRTSENMQSLTQHMESGGMTDREIERMHNELDVMQRRLNEIAPE